MLGHVDFASYSSVFRASVKARQNDMEAMNTLDIENLKRISQNILDPENTLMDLIPHIGELRALLE